ncbi:hypothetical protein [Metabacillus halosaccharovorans]|uniref:hypothetical protein n=1 Tax=Metabacillus halosaccharovorans TaxID=930124 RepID=UPI001C1F5972|nr:hypothetical protein [Metabacillus halosaccharovorans]MBU7593559.1 hypothetical protein [Metabacillus halosaccharovorans]
MNELNKQIAYLTKAINLARGKFPKDDEKQYKAFMYLLHKANLGVDCSEDRYLKIRRLYVRKVSPWREDTDHLAYEYAVKELLGVRVPIFVL